MFSKKLHSKLIIILLSLVSISTWAESNTNEILKKIQELKQSSYESSPTLKILKAKSDQNNSAIYSGLSHHLPNLVFNIKKKKNFFESNSALLQSLGLKTANYQWGIDYQWSLYNYGIVNNSIRNFKSANLENLNYDIGKNIYEIDFNTYLLNYLLSKYKTASITNSINKAETSKKEANVGFDLGQKTKIDVLRAEANFVSLNSKKITYSDEEQNAKSKFLEKSGLKNDAIDFLENSTEAELIETINRLSQTSLKTEYISLPNSPLFNKLNIEAEINNIDANKITQNEWPELKIQGSYENSSDQFSNTWHSPSRSHSVALVLSIPLFSGGSLISSNFEQYFQKKQIAYSKAQSALELDNTLHNNLIKIKALQTLINSLTLNVSQFEELYRLTSKSYSLGKSTLFELLDVQDNLLEAKINLASNKIQLFNLTETYNWQIGNK